MKRTIALSAVGILALTGGVSCAGGVASAAVGSHADAVAAADALRSAAPVIPGSTSVGRRPSRRLHVPDRGYTKLVTRSAFWTVKEGPRRALHDLEASAGNGLSFEGDGSGGGKSIASRLYSADWGPTSTPAGIFYDNLELDVVQIAPGTSAIAAYAQAVPIPPRQADEVIPTTGTTVHVALERNDGDVVRRAAVSGAAADSLIEDFNGLEVIPPGAPPIPCPVDRSGVLLVTFRWEGHALRSTSGFCGFVSVRSGGRSLPNLQDGGTFDDDIRHDLAPKSP